MSEHPFDLIPGYISPLTEDQHAQIGRIALLWGQVEHFVEQLTPHVTGLSWDELDALGVSDKPIGAKALFLKAASARLGDEETKLRVREFCAAIEDTKVARNHAFHGIWGWRGDKRTKQIFPAARKTSMPHAPLKATQLPGLEKRLCRCSRLGFDLLIHFDTPGLKIQYSRFLHHGDRETRPEWFHQWTRRNPIDCAALDRTAKAGRLPHLSAPYPPK
jgi:hypothetical protein